MVDLDENMPTLTVEDPASLEKSIYSGNTWAGNINCYSVETSKYPSSFGWKDVNRVTIGSSNRFRLSMLIFVIK